MVALKQEKFWISGYDGRTADVGEAPSHLSLVKWSMITDLTAMDFISLLADSSLERGQIPFLLKSAPCEPYFGGGRADFVVGGLLVECRSASGTKQRPLINSIKRLFVANKDVLIIGLGPTGEVEGIPIGCPSERDQLRLFVDSALNSLNVLPESYVCRLISVDVGHVVVAVARRRETFHQLYDTEVLPPTSPLVGVATLRVGTRLLVEETRTVELKALEYLTDSSVYMLLRYINAFGNSQGGCLLTGVSDDGVVVGSNLLLRRICGDQENPRCALERVIRNVVSTEFEPPPPPGAVCFEWIPVSGTLTERYVLVIRVARGLHPVTVWVDDCEGDQLFLRREASLHAADPLCILRQRSFSMSSEEDRY